MISQLTMKITMLFMNLVPGNSMYKIIVAIPYNSHLHDKWKNKISSVIGCEPVNVCHMGDNDDLEYLTEANVLSKILELDFVLGAWEEEVEVDLDIRYRCPMCGYTWEEGYTSACDSECPNCGIGNIQSLMWKNIDDVWTAEQEEEWLDCDKCKKCSLHGYEHGVDHNFEVNMDRYLK